MKRSKTFISFGEQLAKFQDYTHHVYFYDFKKGLDPSNVHSIVVFYPNLRALVIYKPQAKECVGCYNIDKEFSAFHRWRCTCNIDNRFLCFSPTIDSPKKFTFKIQ